MPVSSLTLLRPAKVPDSAARAIQQLIAAGGLHGGDRLPTVEALSRQLGVSRGSVREALQVLTTLGMVDVRHGRGTFVREGGQPLDGYATWVDEQRYALLELCELRLAVETTGARIAAFRASDKEIAAIALALAEMRASSGNLSAFAAADTRFHERIIQSSQNRLLEQAMTVTLNLQWEVRLRTLSLPAEINRALAAHDRIMDAIRRRAPDEADAAMREHLRVVEQDLGLCLP